MPSKDPDHYKVEIGTIPNLDILVYRNSDQSGVSPGKVRWSVSVHYRGEDSVTGKLGYFGFETSYACARTPTKRKVARWVREAAIIQLLHEVDEGLKIDGKFYYNPHPNRGDFRCMSYPVFTKTCTLKNPVKKRKR